MTEDDYVACQKSKITKILNSEENQIGKFSYHMAKLNDTNT